MNNAELLASVKSDGRPWLMEGTLRSDFVVVSGDLVQRVLADHPDPDEAFTRQYEEAAGLLHGLTVDFLTGDRSRVIVVPAKHDVSWLHSKHAMSPTADST